MHKRFSQLPSFVQSEEGDFYTKIECLFNISFPRVLHKNNVDIALCVPSQGGDYEADWEGKLRAKKEALY